MLAVAPQLAHDLSRDMTVALVSATNGKSAITAMLTAAVRATGTSVAVNDTGANMMPGLATALSMAPDAAFAVLETDEAVLPRAIRETAPKLIVLGELSRDQLDRHHEVLRVAGLWRDAFAHTDARFVAPSNDPNVVWSLEGHDVVWVDLDTHAELDSVVCPRCRRILTCEAGGWSCACGFVPPPAAVVQRGTHITIDGVDHDAPMALRGKWQHANRALAVTAAQQLGVLVDVALHATSEVVVVGSRPREIEFPSGRRAPIVLVKNPAGWAALIDDLRDDPVSVLYVQHDNAADGRDPSWLWDVPFEALGHRRVVASGIRALDVAVRLDTAGVDVIAVEPDVERAAECFDAGEPFLVAASYTAYYETLRRTQWVQG